jgi:sugar phosphate isomerase/epimerase
VLAVSVTNDFFHFDEARLQIEAAKVGLGMMLASQLGAPVVRVFAGDPTTEEDTSEVMAISTELLGQLKNERCTLALENHGRAFGNPLNVAEVVTGARIGVCFDIGNYVLAGYDPVHAATLLPFPDLIHVKDFRPDPTGPFASPSGQRLAGCRLGEGVVPIAQTLEVLFNKPEAHPIPVHLELECGDDGAQATVTGMDFMRKVLRQFGS